jgi:hypothetical protein
MTTVHIENRVRDFDVWKANFDKFERFRAEHGVQSYRVSRGVVDADEVVVDLEFADEGAAREFLPRLAAIMSSPQAKQQLLTHAEPRLYVLVTEHKLAAAAR